MLPALVTPVPGPASRRLAQRLREVECRNTTYVAEDWPVFWERAEGVNVWDADGNRLLDLTSAFGVATLGHGVAAGAVREQAGRLLHAMGDVHPAVLKVELCERLAALTFGRWTGGRAKTLLGNSGFEAVEAALKTAMLASGRSGVVAFHGGYHGLGYGALLGAGIDWFRRPFEKQLAEVTHGLPFPREGDEPSWEDFLRGLDAVDGKSVGAVLVEPIQGRGGIVVPPAGFLRCLRKWCDAYGVVLIFDEIYTGFHRTGAWFAAEHGPVVPDLICLGKALSGGFPISACVGRAEVMDAWPETWGEALHTSTFLGNPLGCAMALASLEIHARPETEVLACAAGGHLRTSLETLVGEPWVSEIRGRGLMQGIELRREDGTPAGEICLAVVKRLLAEGLVVLPDAPEGHVLALTPPMTMTAEEMEFAVERIRVGLRAFKPQGGGGGCSKG